MKYIPSGSLLFLLLLPIILLAQNNTLCSLTGNIHSESGEPLEGISVTLKNTTYGIYTNIKGEYRLTGLPPGEYTVSFYAYGYLPEEKTIRLKAGENLKANAILRPETQSLETVKLVGATERSQVSHQAYNVTSIDARTLHNSTLDLSGVIDKTSGIRIRETGGVGSGYNVSLNGFTGRQVRIFVDGIPMDNLGSSFQINNIPVNMAERIDVYKGVVPIWLGSDALGGAINIITNTSQQNYLDLSYTYGSFNTHKTALNAGMTTKKGFTVQLNAFQNYSDNNYWVDIELADLQSGRLTPKRVRRFHDTYHNETVIFKTGLVNKKYADRLLFGITLGQNKTDIQTGNRMYDVYGARRREGTIIMPSVTYSKENLLVKGLSFKANGNYNLGSEQIIDTTNRQYNWHGEYRYKNTNVNAKGAEASRTLYLFRNNNGLLNSNLSYQLNEKHFLGLNYTLNTFNRTGSDEANPDDKSLTLPQRTDKHVLGFAYQYAYSKRWNTTLFAKKYYQHNKSSNIYDNEYYIQENAFSNEGYGVASTYYLKPEIQVKSSFEKSFRLPENEEMFGDRVNLDSNPDLVPESSHNFNIGIHTRHKPGKNHSLITEFNFIYRRAKDFIRPNLSHGFSRYINKMVNLRDVTSTGIDGDIRYSYKSRLNLGFNFTYQNLRNQTKYEENTTKASAVYKDRLPNMPFLFGNGNASYTFKNVFARGSALTVGYAVLYVHSFYLRWPSQGNSQSKLDIPMQLSHEAFLTYSMKEGRYNITLECQNLTDAALYDNFGLQKPSRSFYIKLRYFLKK